MFHCDKWKSPFVNNVWSDTNRNWIRVDWKVVGQNPNRRSRSQSVSEDFRIESPTKVNEPTSVDDSMISSLNKLQIEKENSATIMKPVAEILSKIEDPLFIIEFGSGRVDIAYTVGNTLKLEPNLYVILEADRGEDCGKIVAMTSKAKYKKLLNRIDKNEITKEVHPKKIYRLAQPKDVELLAIKQQQEKIALKNCRLRVYERDLSMEIVDCEYQWDMNKLTFYFVSEDRIDFRDLVKELYKVYKTRIWMCSVEKSKNCHLKELLET
ncbi:hypothetical protein TCON_1637 [Astathelohania contejeani]|uniref:PSP1 C-terminal domain-containing protein n=1 Tax=Astathelohania contejeani TaxID=164912 RepID=A0ABQ7HY97_9MICR|nr:hypothetical protein TCON_1637 [Thelohania contejeani]